MNSETFQELLTEIAPLITKQTTHIRKPIPPDEKLAVTLATRVSILHTFFDNFKVYSHDYNAIIVFKQVI